MPTPDTRVLPPRDVVVRVVKADPDESIKFIWVVLAIDDEGKKRYGKAFVGQEFVYVADLADLENDPHLEVIEDPDDRVDAAIAARAERKRLAAIPKTPKVKRAGRAAVGAAKPAAAPVP